MLQRVALGISGLASWRRFTAAVLAGGLCAIALPPFNFFPVLLISFTVLVWLIDGLGDENSPRNIKAAALLGWSV